MGQILVVAQFILVNRTICSKTVEATRLQSCKRIFYKSHPRRRISIIYVIEIGSLNLNGVRFTYANFLSNYEAYR